MSDDIRESVCCPSTTNVGGEQVDTVFGYRVDRNDAHPPPVVTCPDNFTAWMIGDQYIVPDFSSVIGVDGQCAIDSEFTITQNPIAGTVITIGGTITILITVGDRFDNVVTCSFVIDIRNPNVTTPTAPPSILPPWVYQPFLFAYWAANDTLCAIGVPDDDPPCWWRRDLTGYLGNTTPRHLTNAGDVVFVPQESSVPGFSSGLTFDRGSAWSQNQANAYQSAADDTAIRLLSTSFTMRLAFKLVSMADTWNLAGKYLSVGYRLKLVKSGSEYRLSAELRNATTTLETNYYLVTRGEWTYSTMTFDRTTGKLSLYVNGVLISSVTNAAFVLSGEASEFRVGNPAIVGSGGDGMVCWPMNDSTFADSIGTRTLTANGTIGVIAGHIGNAAEIAYGGGANYLQLADEAAMRLNATDWSFRFWLRRTSAPVADIAYLTKWAANLGYEFRMSGADVSYRINNRTAVRVGVLNAIFPLNTWAHHVLTWNNATSVFRHYMDGLLNFTYSLFLSPSAIGTAPFRLQGPAATVQFDEVGIWGSEWDAAKVASDYNASIGTACTSVMSAGAAEIFTDEVGIWLDAWNASRVAADYALMT